MYSIVDGFLVINLYCIKQFLITNIDQFLGFIGLILIIILYYRSYK